MRGGHRNSESLSGTVRAALLLALGLLVALGLGGCGGPEAAGSHSYVHEDKDSVRHVEWGTTEENSFSGSWRGVSYDPEEEDGEAAYEGTFTGRIEETRVYFGPVSEGLSYTGEVRGDEFVMRWEGEETGSRTYTEGSREDYEAAKAGFEEKLQARLAADRALAEAEGVVLRDLHGVAVADSSIEAIAERLGETKAEIDGLAALNERENEENRRLAAEWDPKWDEPDLCKTSDDGELAGEVTYLEFAVNYDPEEARAEYDVELLKEKVEEKREAVAAAEEALSNAEEVPEGAQERLDALRARVEEDAEKVAELDRLVRETNEAYRLAGPKNEEAIDEYQRIRKDACVRD